LNGVFGLQEIEMAAKSPRRALLIRIDVESRIKMQTIDVKRLADIMAA